MSTLRTLILLTGLMLSSAFAIADDFCTNPTLPPPPVGDDDPTPAPTLLRVGSSYAFSSHRSGPPPQCDRNGCPKGPLCGIARIGTDEVPPDQTTVTCVGGNRGGNLRCITTVRGYLENTHLPGATHSWLRFDLLTRELAGMPIGFTMPVAEVLLADGGWRSSALRLGLHRIGSSGSGDFEVVMSGSFVNDWGQSVAITEAPVRLWSPGSPIRIDWGSDADATHPGMPMLTWSIDGYGYSRILGGAPVGAISRVGNLGSLLVPSTTRVGFGDLNFSD